MVVLSMMVMLLVVMMLTAVMSERVKMEGALQMISVLR